MSRWRQLFDGSGPRIVAGVMSGTSLDGIDVAVVRVEGSGRDLDLELLGTASQPFPASLEGELRTVAEAADYPVGNLNLLNVRLADCYADAVHHALAVSGLDAADLHLVGCHGQTVRHRPRSVSFAGGEVAATLQLGSGPSLSVRLGVPVISDFRSADVALGGQGAPLVPYFDYTLLASPNQHRVVLNLGGIANITALAAGGAASEVIAFDTGPANMVMDALSQRLFGEPFDRDGMRASAGQILEPLLQEALAAPFFALAPPKSAGRQADGAGFGVDYAETLIEKAGRASGEDLLATAAALTAFSVSGAIERFVPFVPEVVIASGGGTRNRFLMGLLSTRLTRLATSDEFGVDAHYKEAMAFAVLAHEAVNGVETGMPSVTGASRSAVLGSLSWP